MIDFTAFRLGKQPFAELVAPVTYRDLYSFTNAMIDTMRALLVDVSDHDVSFVPEDPAAQDPFAANPEDIHRPWTLGHVIVHATASGEESAALALTLARGIVVEGRSRYEVPWERIHTVEQLMRRLDESRRIRLGMLDAWPDPPHLDVTYTPNIRTLTGPVNAIGRFVLGLNHDDVHLDQIRSILAQAHQHRMLHGTRNR